MDFDFQYHINSIYLATEGEGRRLGTPQIFVRFQGCSIGCVNCDSPQTWEFTPSSLMPEEKVWSEIARLSTLSSPPIKQVSITGGDPLHPKHDANLKRLVAHLRSQNYFINIEASGTRVVEDIFDQVDFISMDIKTPSTKVRTNENLIAKSVQLYAEKMQIKSVIAGRTDFDWIVQFHAKLQAQWKTQNPPERKFPDWVLTPCIPHGEQIDLAAFHQVLQLNLQAGGLFHVVGQQHKWVYGSSQEYV